MLAERIVKRVAGASTGDRACEASRAKRPGERAMSARWRWILAMGFSALVLFGGLVMLYQGGPDFAAVAWMLIIIGLLSVVVNLVMRNRFVP